MGNVKPQCRASARLRNLEELWLNDTISRSPLVSSFVRVGAYQPSHAFHLDGL